MLDRLIAATRRWITVGVWIAGAFMIVSAFLVGVEVVLRKVGGLAISGADEIAGYMLAVSSAWAFSFTLLNRSNIRFDMVYNWLPRGGRAVLDVLGHVALAGFMFLVTWRGVEVVATTIRLGARANTPLATPLWLPQSLWLAGLLFLCWTIVLIGLRVGVALARRDYATVRSLAGIEMTEEEVEREIHVGSRPGEERAARAIRSAD